MASLDTLCRWFPQDNLSPNWLYVPFFSGSVAPSKGDTIWGDTSNANAVLELVVLTGGSWAGGDASGIMILSNWNGVAWTSGENFTKNQTTPDNNGTFSGAPVSAFATQDLIRQDTPVLAFDATSDEVALFADVMPSHYSGGGLTLTVGVVSTTAVGDMVFGAAFKSITDDVDNLGSVGADPSGLKVFAEPNYNTAIDAASVAGEVKYFTITFTSGEIDGVAAGEYFQLYLLRRAGSADDDMAADALVVFAVLSET